MINLGMKMDRVLTISQYYLGFVNMWSTLNHIKMHIVDKNVSLRNLVASDFEATSTSFSRSRQVQIILSDFNKNLIQAESDLHVQN